MSPVSTRLVRSPGDYDAVAYQSVWSKCCLLIISRLTFTCVTALFFRYTVVASSGPAAGVGNELHSNLTITGEAVVLERIPVGL